MTPLRLIFRNLFHFRAASLAVLVGMIVGTAVLAGSLMVGDSVRGSLRSLAVERLGPVDYALVANRFFGAGGDDSLAQRLNGVPGVSGRFQFVPAVIANGSAAVDREGKKTRVGDMQMLALGTPVGSAAAGGETWPSVEPKQATLNAEAAAALGVGAAGDSSLAFTLPSKEEAVREGAIAQRDSADLSGIVTVDRVAAIAPDRGMLGLFNLAGGQRTPKNAWLNLADVQEAIRQPNKANVLLTRDAQANLAVGDDHAAADRATAAIAQLNQAVKAVAKLADYGLKADEENVSKATGERYLSSVGTYLDAPIVAAAIEAARKVGAEPQLVTVNLVNRVSAVDTAGKELPGVTPLRYVIGAGVSRLGDRAIAPDEIVFNEVTARQMNVAEGQLVRLAYYRRDADGHLKEVDSAADGLTFRVGPNVPMSGIGADGSLTPEFKGLTDVDSVANWRAPAELNIDSAAATASNEPYWSGDKAKGVAGYGKAPRLFIHIDAARKLWGGPFGDITSVRVPGDKGAAFAEMLKTTIDPATLGFTFQPIKTQQLAASAGSTDFSMLFVGFSFFLIAAAVLLVAMLFRLNVEQRVRQFGVLAAVGFAPGRLRWLALAEGAMLAIVGGVIGIAVAVLYTWVMVYGLRTWWVGAIGTTALQLHVLPKTLWAGFIFGFWVAVPAVLWAVWRLGKVTPAKLMAGQLAPTPRGVKSTAGRWPRFIGVGLFAAGMALLVLVLTRVIKQPETALGGGAILLAGALTFLAGVLRPGRHEVGRGDVRSAIGLGVRNANRQTARSVLSVGLIAFAAFTLITVASMQQQGAGDTGDKDSGSGGFRLIVQSAVPILHDLNTPAGRASAGIIGNDPFDDWAKVKFIALRRWAGQDISCLNLTRPTAPTVLGVPPAMIARGGFSFASQIEKADNPWTLIDRPIENDVIPVIADNETAAYILKLGLGDTFDIADQQSRPRKLKLVATLSHSIFQSELLMSEANFRTLFPAQAGFGTLLVDAPPANVEPIRRALQTELESYALSVDTTAARLQAYQQIQNTYLSTFKALGSLGLALGTIGLAVVLIRNVIERRSELALLAAIGFSSASRVKIVLAENVLLLVLGLGVGTACAMLGVTPTLLSSRGGVAWGPLAATLIGVLVLGLVASVIAVAVSGTKATPADLRRE